jgi:multidrug efflux system membrane fusion protein
MYTPQAGRRYSASIVPYRQITLAFRTSGFVEWILPVQGADGRTRDVGTGDPVAQGARLARIRAQDYALRVNQAQGQLGEARKAESAARAQLAQAEAAASKAAQDFQRASNLLAAQAITRPDFEAARAQRDGADAQVAGARAQLEAAGERVRTVEAAVSEAGLVRDDTEMTAPFSGFVVQRQIEVGALVAPGTPAFTIADLESVKAVFGLPDLEVANLRVGRTLTLTAEALPGRTFRGTVTAISPVAETTTRLFPVELTVENPQRALLAGMIVSVEPGAARQDPVLVAPVSAVVRARDANRFAVVVVEDSNGQTKAAIREVTLGDTFGDRIQVRQGLKEGERIVVSGASMVIDGETVRVIP